MRPVRPEDESKYPEFLGRTSETDLYFRFFQVTRTLSHDDLARFTQIDYDREMAFVATRRAPGGEPETIGVVRTVADPDNDTAEFSVVVRTDQKRRGIATLLMAKMLAYCRGRGTRALEGDVLADNQPMLELVRRLGGAQSRTGAEEGVVRVVFPLR